MRGISHGAHGAVVGVNDAEGQGIWGESTRGEGVRGMSHSTHSAVVGVNDGGGQGVYGESTQSEGVRGISHSAHGGVVGVNDGGGQGVWGSSNQNEGVHGESNSPTAAAVAGIALNPNGTGAGIHGESRGQGPAGFFKGNVVVTGDIFLQNADCAEDFDIAALDGVEPGSVMVIGQDGALLESAQAYDKRVAGVVSGGGDYKPGIVLDRRELAQNRKSIALLGKVYCKVDASRAPVEVGDLLTTSPTPGHAMKAADPRKVFGAVIGKALRPLATGHGLIPILVLLQ
jgi:hypothetical protein